MVLIRLWLIALVLTVISWFLLKLIRKPIHIGWVFLFWVAAIFGTMGLIYAGSVWLASN
ncbi:hypothetical protein [Thiomicrorhabdus sp. Kp2]|uniref:hypothetical protein n=1 Tax=Thiomicrorhabdus sp. Kp2 TaxID=1123518 RepID=UPI000408EEDB|nr:hypothetical protein [Thiomicrorhabdus sp. Kp2]